MRRWTSSAPPSSSRTTRYFPRRSTLATRSPWSSAATSRGSCGPGQPQVENVHADELLPLEPRRQLGADRLDLRQLRHDVLLDDVEEDSVRSGWRRRRSRTPRARPLPRARPTRRRARGSRRARPLPSPRRRASQDRRPRRHARPHPPSSDVLLRAPAPRCRPQARRRRSPPRSAEQRPRGRPARPGDVRGRDRRPVRGSTARTPRAPIRRTSPPSRAAGPRPDRYRDRRARASVRRHRARAR